MNESLKAEAVSYTHLDVYKRQAPILQKAKKALRRLGLTARVEAGGGGMDANIFNAKGLTSLGIATGYSKNHTLEENLDELSFIKSGRLVELLIEDS